jgi:acyl dehydratase
MNECTFDDLQAGQRYTSAGITLTEAAMVDFALSYDPQPIHVDAHAAAGGPFGGLIASGIHTLAICCRLVQLTKPWVAACLGSPGIDELRWLKPVRAGDTLHVVTEIRELRPSRSRPDRGTVLLRHEVINQDGDVVLTFNIPELVARRAGSTTERAPAP